MVAYATIKRDYIYLEFLKVAHEAILLNMFPSFDEQSQLAQFATTKFEAEVEREQKAAAAKQDPNAGNASASGESSGYDSDGPGSYDSGFYEKKELILKLGHIILWKVESTPSVDATL
mmetsp:Transcript_47510/g.62841  ORF Transcript_47510/g.62841 Transcript_47510/m.62841 type:complete len:118 (+) Transcript_47510:1361-1714(+)